MRVIVGSLSLAYFFLNFLLASSLLLEESCAADTPPFYYNFPSHNFFRNFFAKSFVDSIIFVTFAVSYLAESSIWAKAGWTYIHKGVTVRFGLTYLNLANSIYLSKTKQRERLMGCIIYTTLISSWHFCN